MKIVDYITDLYIYKKIDCFGKMRYEEKAYATSLILDELEGKQLNQIHDYMVNYGSTSVIRYYLAKLLSAYEDHISKEDEYTLHQGLVNLLKQGAIELAKNTIDEIFDKLDHGYIPKEPDQDDDSAAFSCSREGAYIS